MSSTSVELRRPMFHTSWSLLLAFTLITWNQISLLTYGSSPEAGLQSHNHSLWKSNRQKQISFFYKFVTPHIPHAVGLVVSTWLNWLRNLLWFFCRTTTYWTRSWCSTLYYERTNAGRTTSRLNFNVNCFEYKAYIGLNKYILCTSCTRIIHSAYLYEL